jgi:antitoxin (DNA-binding transcriptional repressor) of toxin-antitoxin stability system
MHRIVRLCDARTHLAAPVARATAGEAVAGARDGTPQPRCVTAASHGPRREPANTTLIRRVAADFDARNAGAVRLSEGCH